MATGTRRPDVHSTSGGHAAVAEGDAWARAPPDCGVRPSAAVRAEQEAGHRSTLRARDPAVRAPAGRRLRPSLRTDDGYDDLIEAEFDESVDAGRCARRCSPRAAPTTRRTSGASSPCSAASRSAGGSCCWAAGTGVAWWLGTAVARAVEDPRQHGDRAQRAARAVGLDARPADPLLDLGLGPRLGARAVEARAQRPPPREHQRGRQGQRPRLRHHARGRGAGVGAAPPGPAAVEPRSTRCIFEYGIAMYDLDLGDSLRSGRASRPSSRAEMRTTARRVGRNAAARLRAAPAALSRRPGPRARRSTANLVANLVRNVWSHSVIMCGHFPEGVATFEVDELDEDETRGRWYVRQMLGSADISGPPAAARALRQPVAPDRAPRLPRPAEQPLRARSPARSASSSSDTAWPTTAGRCCGRSRAPGTRSLRMSLPAGGRPTVSATPARVPAFVPGGEFTVGVEDELMLVDAAGELLGAGRRAAGARACSRLAGRDWSSGEVYVDQVELTSPVCRGGEDVARQRCTGLRSVAGGRGRADPVRRGPPDGRRSAAPCIVVVAALRPDRRRVRRSAAHARPRPPGARRAARRGRR